MKRCVKCNRGISCSCSAVTIENKIYCKQCAIEIFRSKNNNVNKNANSNVNSNINSGPMNTNLFNIKIIR